MLLDGSGTLIAGSADQGNIIGKHFAEHALARDMLADDEGTMTVAGFDGVRRIFAYVRVPWTQARLAVGLDENAVHSGIDREIDFAYLQLGALRHCSFCSWRGSAASSSWCGRSGRWFAPRRVSAAAICMCGRRRSPGSPNSRRWRPRSTTWRRKLAAREEELQIANEHLEELASLDGLTGLANRRGFDRQIERDWQRAGERREPLALMMIDIDHFKLFNDRYGHVAGDTCLRAVGETLSLVTLEDAVLVARYGGEEFALLLPGLDLDARRGARRRSAQVDRRSPDQSLRIAVRPCHHQHRRRGLVPEKFQTRRRIWSRRPTTRSMTPNAAAATTWSRMSRATAARGVLARSLPLRFPSSRPSRRFGCAGLRPRAPSLA